MTKGMTMGKSRLLFFMLAFMAIAVLPNIAIAQNHLEEFKAYRVIPLRNGANRIDLNGDGVKDLIFLAWRENYNAHGFDIYTFYLNASSLKDASLPKDPWYLIPFFDEKGAANTYTTAMGADFILSDIRILQPKSSDRAPVLAVIGVRELGLSYAEEASVKFIIYEMKANREGVVGQPPCYFQQARIIPVTKKYRDVNEAFQEELGLGWSRRDRPKE
jgi:hypothetical protein